MRTYRKPTETCQYTHFTSCHPPGAKKGFIKGEAIRLLRTNSSKTTFEEALSRFKARLEEWGYPKRLIERTLSKVNFSGRQSALKQKAKNSEKILPFVTTYNPAVSNLQTILTRNWSVIIQNQPLLAKILKKPPLISYNRGKSLKDMLVKAKLWIEVFRIICNHKPTKGRPCWSVTFFQRCVVQVNDLWW